MARLWQAKSSESITRSLCFTCSFLRHIFSSKIQEDQVMIWVERLAFQNALDIKRLEDALTLLRFLEHVSLMEP